MTTGSAARDAQRFVGEMQPGGARRAEPSTMCRSLCGIEDEARVFRGPAPVRLLRLPAGYPRWPESERACSRQSHPARELAIGPTSAATATICWAWASRPARASTSSAPSPTGSAGRGTEPCFTLRVAVRLPTKDTVRRARRCSAPVWEPDFSLVTPLLGQMKPAGVGWSGPASNGYSRRAGRSSWNTTTGTSVASRLTSPWLAAERRHSKSTSMST
jgi:hypothetical protein